MKTKQKAGLTRSAFTKHDDGEPGEITATDAGIEMAVFFDGEPTSRIVKLRPRHIEAIVAMHGAWWESRWAAVHEAEA